MKKYIYTTMLLILLVITLFILPIWNVETVKVVGNNYYTSEDILQSTTFREGMHILRMKKKKMIEQINKLPHIKSATIRYGFPNKVTIEVTERIPMGYVKFLDSYLCIDEEGYVIDEGSEKHLKLPEIEGLKFKQFVVGEKLPVENSEQLPAIKEMINILNKYEFTSEIDTIEVSNIQQIHLYVDRLNVIIGNIRDFDKKVKYLIEVHKQYAMGILDLSLVEHTQVILKPMK